MGYHQQGVWASQDLTIFNTNLYPLDFNRARKTLFYPSTPRLSFHLFYL